MHIRVHVIEAWKGIAAREIGIWGQLGSSCSITLVAGLQIFHFGGIDPVDGRIWTGLYALRALHEVDELARLGHAPLELINGPDPSFPPPSDCNGNRLSDAQDVADGTSEDCAGNGIPDECEADCNGNGIADGCDIASGTSQDRNGNGVPGECEPELIQIMGGLGPAPDSFVSPLGEYVPFDTVDLDLTADVEFALPVVPGFTLTSNGGGNHTLTSDAAVPVGVCERVSFDVRDLETREIGTITFTLCHLPLYVSQAGCGVNISDVTAFGEEFRGRKDARLVDINGDGVVDIRDATAFGNHFFGRRPATRSWNGECLP